MLMSKIHTIFTSYIHTVGRLRIYCYGSVLNCEVTIGHAQNWNSGGLRPACQNSAKRLPEECVTLLPSLMGLVSSEQTTCSRL